MKKYKKAKGQSCLNCLSLYTDKDCFKLPRMDYVGCYGGITWCSNWKPKLKEVDVGEDGWCKSCKRGISTGESICEDCKEVDGK